MAANQIVNAYGKLPQRYLEQIPKNTRKEVFGLNFPIGGEKKSGGYFSKGVGIKTIKDAVSQLLRTEKGERIMLPNFGCNLRKFLFQPLDEALFESIKREIQYSFNNYIVGASITRLSVFPSGEVGAGGGSSIKVILNLKLDTSDLEIFTVEVTIA